MHARIGGTILLLAAGVLVFPTTVSACTVCLAFPKKTIADHLLGARRIVFARLDPADPFAFAPVEVLKGGNHGIAIDRFADSRTRGRLNASEESVVVLVQAPEDKGWRSLGVADSAYVAVVRRILALAPGWRRPGGDKQRIEFFAKLFGHKNATLHELSYLELSRAPYPFIRRLSQVVSKEQLAPMLTRRQFLHWRPLAILLLAHRAEPEDRAYIENAFRNASELGLTTNLAAWAAATIELKQAEAIRFIETEYFRRPSRSHAEVIAMWQAVSVHGSEGHTHLRDQIVASYEGLLETHPDFAKMVSNDLSRWNRREYAARLGQLAKDPKTDAATALAINDYLRRVKLAQKAKSPRGDEKKLSNAR